MELCAAPPPTGNSRVAAAHGAQAGRVVNGPHGVEQKRAHVVPRLRQAGGVSCVAVEEDCQRAALQVLLVPLRDGRLRRLCVGEAHRAKALCVQRQRQQSNGSAHAGEGVRVYATKG
eukprot:366169-Chlamydomonas_euryale.AAC.6